LQSIGPKVNQQTKDQIGHGGISDGGIVLPRFLRKPARQISRFLSGGFQISRRGMFSFGLLFAVAAGVAALSQGDNNNRIKTELAGHLGLAINAYEISGNREVTDIDIVALLAPEHGASILSYDAEHARDALKSNPWISDASVSKIYPNKLAIKINERQPFALWQSEHGLMLIDRQGLILTQFDGRKIDLPLVVGAGAEKSAAAMLSILQRVPELAVNTKALIRVGDRRWDLELLDGTTVMLPEKDVAGELIRFAKIERENELLTRDINRIDLRFKDRMIVKLSEDAAGLVKAKREEQLNVIKKSMKERQI
jgi:cell division protein FtsQ